jgi:hypothetical protein
LAESKEARTYHLSSFRVTQAVGEELKRMQQEQKRDSVCEIVRIAIDEYLEKQKTAQKQ